MKESIKFFVFTFIFIFCFSIEAQNKLKIKYDDGGIIEGTFRDNDDPVIVLGEWYVRGYEEDYYSLEENGNNVILGNLHENTIMNVFIGEDETTCRSLTVSDQLVIDPTDGYNNYCFSSVGFEILPH